MQNFREIQQRREYNLPTADFILKVLAVYIYPMETMYLSLRAQVAVGTFFMKSPISGIRKTPF